MKEIIEQMKERKAYLPLKLQFFAEGGDGGAGGDGGDGGDAGGKGEKTFTQAELDAAIQARLARAETALAKKLGFDSVEDMQAALKKPDDKKTEDKKAKDEDPVDVDALLEEKLKARLKEQEKKTFQRLLTAEVKIVANELGFADWEDAYKLAELSEVKENEKGEIEGVKEALEDLAKKKPHLLKTKQGSGAFGAHVPNSRGSDKKPNEDIIKLAQSRGISANNQAAYDPWAK